jgi:hypothetical protein
VDEENVCLPVSVFFVCWRIGVASNFLLCLVSFLISFGVFSLVYIIYFFPLPIPNDEGDLSKPHIRPY